MPLRIASWSKLFVDLIIFIFKIKLLGIFQARLIIVFVKKCADMFKMILFI